MINIDMHIYLITNLVNGNQYVGQTIKSNAYSRWISHKSDSKLPKMSISKAMKKYGVDNFSFDVLESGFSDNETLNEAEIKWISQYNTYKGRGYNCNIGGGNCSPSNITRKKISKTLSGKYVGTLNPNSKRVTQIDKNTYNEIACWFSLGDVEAEFDVSRSTIGGCCRGEQKTSIRFIWKFSSDELRPPSFFVKERQGKRVVQLNKDTGEEIAVYFNSLCASQVLSNTNCNHIRSVCDGNRITNGGFKWRYLDVII